MRDFMRLIAKFSYVTTPVCLIIAKDTKEIREIENVFRFTFFMMKYLNFSKNSIIIYTQMENF